MVLHQLRKFDGRTVTSAETYLSNSQDTDDANDDNAGTDTHCISCWQCICERPSLNEVLIHVK